MKHKMLYFASAAHIIFITFEICFLENGFNLRIISVLSATDANVKVKTKTYQTVLQMLLQFGFI